MKINDNKVIGIIGLGLMGTSIAAALALKDQKIIAVAPMGSDLDKEAPKRIRHFLEKCQGEGLTGKAPEELMENIHFTTDYADLKSCWLVIECVVEDLDIKREVFKKIEQVVSHEVMITSNTSAIPISILQADLEVPERFYGMHWAEPAYTSPFLEIICGDRSPIEGAEQLYEIAKQWGKEPTLVRKDVRGFITNRIMYAMYREAFHLVENGYATVADVDRACKNAGGQWMAFCGLFRYMDLTGLKAYHAVMGDLFPELSNRKSVPKLIDDIAKANGNGVFNGKGFYDYTPEEAEKWKETFEKFAFDMNRLSKKYAAELEDISNSNNPKQ
ncbi:3-hydroxyacyl-CoA dehydrogenase family protein [Pricia sp. S334]|uniref:3-hydroxyacyl-CoA dehydrogenase family protein n=1 Tax=Pricia mediterranea TaxID=3076079 RepID=A0ABU3L9M5_9FLAO|nr:3-hydroxyacyl-CoA dehydrogenase family protein [Pricia sp. S334]MDT7830098.1 3-hydroxyacyl-CoA dehydrogenase family protein [Pricia sp. S334]